jgi:hypothetical protein
MLGCGTQYPHTLTLTAGTTHLAGRLLQGLSIFLAFTPLKSCTNPLPDMHAPHLSWIAEGDDPPAALYTAEDRHDIIVELVVLAQLGQSIQNQHHRVQNPRYLFNPHRQASVNSTNSQIWGMVKACPIEGNFTCSASQLPGLHAYAPRLYSSGSTFYGSNKTSIVLQPSNDP